MDRRILKARERDIIGSKSVRKFTVPKLNVDALDYIDLYWEVETVLEPPITKKLSNAEILCFLDGSSSIVFESPKFPCHTQATERRVKLVTEASSSTCDETRRDGFILARTSSRNLNPAFNSKSQYHF